MSNKKDRELKENLGRCYSMVLQSSAKGISADEIARKLNIHRTTVYHHLSSLKLTGKVENDDGIWHAKMEEQTIKPVEKEIVIELPLPKNQLQPVALLETLAQDAEEHDFPRLASTYKVFLETLRETRTIKIKGKNVDDLDLEKIGNLIQQANKKSSKIDLKGLFKSMKEQLPLKKKTELAVSNQNTVTNEHS